MIMDLDLLFSNSQVITVTAASTNLIDLAPLGVPYAGGSNTGRNVGVGQELWIFVSVELAFTDSGSDATLAIALQTDTDVAFGSPVTVQTLDTLVAVTPAGSKFFYRLPISNTAATAYERYIRLNYTVANGPFTQNTISSGIVMNVDKQDNVYASGYSTGF